MDHSPPSSYAEQDRLNLTRTWFCITNVDMAYATQFGRPPIIQRPGHITGITRTWFCSSALNMPGDILLCGFTELYCLMCQFSQSIGQDVETREVIQLFPILPIDVLKRFFNLLERGEDVFGDGR